MAAPHNDNIKGKILSEATKLLQKKPFAEVSISEIAKSAGVSKGSVYYYYKNKDDILYDIADGYLDLLYNDLMVWITDSNKDTSFPRLLRYSLLRGTDDPGKSLRLHLTIDAIAGNVQIREKLLAKYKTFRNAFAKNVSERRPGANGEYYGWLIMALVDGLMIQKLLNNEELNIEEFIEEFIKETCK